MSMMYKMLCFTWRISDGTDIDTYCSDAMNYQTRLDDGLYMHPEPHDMTACLRRHCGLRVVTSEQNMTQALLAET